MPEAVNPQPAGTDATNPSPEVAVTDSRSAIERVSQMLEPEGQPSEGERATPKANRKAKAAEEPEAEAESLEEAPEETGEESDDAAQQEVEGEEGETEPDDGGDVDIPDQWDALAEALGVEPDDLANHIKVPVTVNGKQQMVTLAEARKGYQLDADYRHKTSELAEQRRTFDAELQAKRAETQARFQQVEEVATVLAQRLANQFSDQRMSQILESEGPEAYIAAQREQQQLQREIQQVQALKAQGQQDATRKQAEFRQQQQRLLAEKIPDFQNPEKVAREERDMTAYLKAVEFSEREIGEFFNGPFDHRQIMILRDAARYRALQNGKKELTKKVKAKPILKKPGAAKSEAADTSRTSLRDRLKQAGKRGSKRQRDNAAKSYVASLLD